MRIIGLRILLVIFSIVGGGCDLVVNRLAFYPDNEDVIQESLLPQGVHEFSVVTEDNVNIQNLYLPVEGSDKILIYFHGNAGNIYHRIPSLLQLQAFGVNVIGVSYRGYGKSEGDPSEKGIYLDGEAVLKYAIETLGFSKKDVVIFGRSIGTTVAINTAQYQEIGGLILVSPLTSGEAQAEAGGLSFISSLAGNAFDNITKIKNIKAPLLVIHGTHDRVVPYSMGQELFNSAKVRKKFIQIDGAGHNNLQGVYRQAYWLPVLSFIKTI